VDNLEKKKILIEEAKVLEGVLRTLVLSVLTIGAGEGTLILGILLNGNKLNSEQIFVYKVILTGMTLALIVLMVVIIKVSFSIKKRLG